MRKGDRRTIEVDGKAIEAEFIGAGRHARAYRDGNTVYLFVFDDEEYMKEVFNWIPDDTPHLPNVKQHDEGREGRKRYGQGQGQIGRVYSMPYSRTIKASDREAWAILKTLREAADRIHREKYIHGRLSLAVDGLYFFNDVIEDTRGKVPESVTDALTELMNAGSNYGSGVACEFGPRNVGVDEQGRIVFRDILFDAEKMHREMMAKMKANRGW